MRQIVEDTPGQLNLTVWSDSLVESVGHRPGSAYIEAVWLGILGPSATWCWQRLARMAAANMNAVDTVDLAVSLGLGEGLSRSAPISRTLGRLVAFDTAHRAGDTLAVRVALGDIPERRAARLSWSARLAHEHLGRRAVLTGRPGNGVEPSLDHSAAPDGLML
jgi:hypothetical protein